jgi:hypothetical protein
MTDRYVIFLFGIVYSANERRRQLKFEAKISVSASRVVHNLIRTAERMIFEGVGEKKVASNRRLR